MDRIARDTKQPEMLREIFTALGNEPAVIAECLARPVLAERLVRELAAQNQNRNSGSQWLRVASSPKAIEDAFAMNTAKRAPTVAQVSAGTYALPEITSTSSNCSDNWTATSGGASTGAVYNAAVWTGSEMIVWGGTTGAPYYNTGDRYDPSTDSWTATSLTNAPDARANHTAVWTGTEMIIWGGYAPNSGPGIVNTGGRYNPTADTWTATTTTNAPAGRDQHTTVWTGSEMIVWGGTGLGDFDASTGGRYNPTTDSWTATSRPFVPCGMTNCPLGFHAHTAVWTGSEMIVWGGSVSGSIYNTGGRYNPTTDSWTPTAVPTTCNPEIDCAPAAREWHTAVWTGSEMVVWGGNVCDPNSCTETNTGGKYDPNSDSWTATAITDAPSARRQHTAVWTGAQMVVWGGGFTDQFYNFQKLSTGPRYDPAADSQQLHTIHVGLSLRTFAYSYLD
jgi:hypothetical protein